MSRTPDTIIIVSDTPATMLGLSYHHAEIVIAHIVCSLIAGLAVFTRFYVKIKTKQGLKKDDHLILLTLLLYYAAVAVVLQECFTNFGPYTRPQVQNMHLDDSSKLLSGYRKAMLIAFLVVITAQYTCKLSILLFYRRIFSTSSFHQRASLSLIIFTSLWYLSTTITTVCICRPLALAFSPDEDVKLTDERNKFRDSWTDIIHVFLTLDAAIDLAILLVPIRTAFTLQMARRAKVGLAGIFALGGFVVITNAVRISLFFLGREKDPDEIFYHVTELWTSIHVCTAVLCACLPYFKPLWQSVSTKVRTKVTGMKSGKDQGSFQGSELGVLNSTDMQDWKAIRKTVTVHQTSSEEDRTV